MEMSGWTLIPRDFLIPLFLCFFHGRLIFLMGVDFISVYNRMRMIIPKWPSEISCMRYSLYPLSSLGSRSARPTAGILSYLLTLMGVQLDSRILEYFYAFVFMITFFEL